jgi:vacuolar iron transporter family protein
MGEWVSVQSARELFLRQLEEERIELRDDPGGERAELVEIYTAKGLTAAEAGEVADRIMGDPRTALDTMAREELGIDPDGLGGSPWQASWASFALFVAGALPPVVPFALTDDRATAIVASLVLSAVMLFVIGALITRLTGRSWLLSGLRQLAFGLTAAAVTYAIGALVQSLL